MTLSQVSGSHLAVGQYLWGTMFIWATDPGLRGKDEELMTLSDQAPYPIHPHRGFLGASLTYILLRSTLMSLIEQSTCTLGGVLLYLSVPGQPAGTGIQASQ